MVKLNWLINFFPNYWNLPEKIHISQARVTANTCSFGYCNILVAHKHHPLRLWFSNRSLQLDPSYYATVANENLSNDIYSMHHS